MSVAGTPTPDGDGGQLADDYALAARWAADAGADIVEVHLSCPNTAGEHAQMIFENPALSALIVDRVRRAVGQRPIIAKIGATRSPRALHGLASRLAPRLDGFVLVNGLERRVVKPDQTAAFAGETRATAGVVGATVFEHALMQVDELVSWRKAGAWSRTILAVGGITTTDARPHRPRRGHRWRPGRDGSARRPADRGALSPGGPDAGSSAPLA